MDLTVNHKKIFILSFMALFILLFSWLILYLPGEKRISILKQELIATQQQIRTIEMLLAGSPNKDEAIRLLKLKQQYLNNKFPREEAESLRLIPEFARKGNIEVISLQSGLKTELRDESGKQKIIENRIVNYLPITMEVRCFYKDLVKYLQEIESQLPAFIRVISLAVSKDSQFTGKVWARIELNLYLLI
jgi:hypothetical protein